MEDVYLIHTFNPITIDKIQYKNENKEQIQTNLLKNSNYNNALVQIYTKIIDCMKQK